MKTKYDTYNRWASFFIVTCETLITGGLFYALFLATESTPWYKILKAPHLQVILTVMLCYFVSAIQIGVVLYRRKVYAYQIIGRVLRSTIFFGVLSGVVLELGNFMDAWSYFYLPRAALCMSGYLPYHHEMGDKKISFQRRKCTLCSAGG